MCTHAEHLGVTAEELEEARMSGQFEWYLTFRKYASHSEALEGLKRPFLYWEARTAGLSHSELVPAWDEIEVGHLIMFKEAGVTDLQEMREALANDEHLEWYHRARAAGDTHREAMNVAAVLVEPRCRLMYVYGREHGLATNEARDLIAEVTANRGADLAHEVRCYSQGISRGISPRDQISAVRAGHSLGLYIQLREKYGKDHEEIMQFLAW